MTSSPMNVNEDNGVTHSCATANNDIVEAVDVRRTELGCRCHDDRMSEGVRDIAIIVCNKENRPRSYSKPEGEL